ncbi:MAG: diaminopimelate decarboxylase [Ignavibacteria bacterium]|nr:diaminopimelate decarboxylase [Ignavibacteria bacterium]
MNYEELKYKLYTDTSIDALKNIYSEYESPVFVYSKKTISNSYRNLINALPDKFKIFYAQKSNPNPGILKHISSLGAGCDTASLGEMKSALEAGFNENKIMLTGPAKTENEIRFAIENNLSSINVESVQELLLVNKIASEHGKTGNILVRINPPYESGEPARIIGGTGISKFGIDIEQMDDFFKSLKDLKNVSLKGIHIFNSSQILSGKKIFNNTKNVIDTAVLLSREYSFDISRIDLGGGFGTPYSEKEKPLDTAKLGNDLNVLIESKNYRDFLKDVDLIFEPGRYLSGRAGIYLTKVLYNKTSRGKNILLIDGGIHHLLRPALIGQPHPVVNLTAVFEDRNGRDEYMIAGPLCTSFDSFGEHIILPETKQGDILAVMNAGAYGFTESMPLFLSHPQAKEIFTE